MRISAIGGLAFALAVPSSALAWTFTTIDPAAGTNFIFTPGRGVAFAYSTNDFGNGPVEFRDVAYYKGGDLWYASASSAGNWSKIQIATTGDVGRWPSITHDGNSSPHIVHYYETAHILSYAWLIGGSAGNCGGGAWQCQAVQTLSAGSQAQSAIAYDYLTDKRHVIYDEGGKIKYTTKAGNCGPPPGCVWSAPTSIDTSTGTIYEVGAIDLDSNKLPHVAYLVNLSAPGDVAPRWAVRSGGVWTLEDMSDDIINARHVDMEVDYQDVPRACVIHCTTTTQCKLMYAKRTGVNTWLNTTVDSSVVVNSNQESATCSIASRGNTTYISYYDSTNLRLASNTLLGGGWTNVAVDSPQDTGWHSSIGVSPDFGVSIAYFDFEFGDLRFAAD